MIKKYLHYFCVLLAGSLTSALLLLLYWQAFNFFYHINIFSVQTYKLLADYWNGGGTLKAGDLLMILIFISYFPLAFYLWRKLAKYKYLNLLTTPLNWLSNYGLGKYSGGMPEVNIKNLKIEEKKTIEQLVKERIELENKKNPKKDTSEFRKEIIEKIENEVK